MSEGRVGEVMTGGGISRGAGDEHTGAGVMWVGKHTGGGVHGHTIF